MIKGDTRVFSFVAGQNDLVTIADLNLPEGCALMFLYRNEKLLLPDDKTELQEGDEAVIISHSDVLAVLKSRWNPSKA